jgi:hypothetical protein
MISWFCWFAPLERTHILRDRKHVMEKNFSGHGNEMKKEQENTGLGS